MNIKSVCRNHDDAVRLRDRFRKLRGRIPEGEDARKYLSKKDRKDCDRMMNQYLGGGFGSLPPLSAYADFRKRLEADARCTSKSKC